MEEQRREPPEAELPPVVAESHETDYSPQSPEVTPQVINEKVLAEEAIKKQPIAAFEHVAKAAEEGEAVEKLYELRHEVKDEASQQPVVPISTVIAGMPPRQPEPVPTAQATPPPIEPPLAVQTTDEEEDDDDYIYARPSMYRHAIKSGFVAALTLIGFYILFRILF